jgi:hypothetical protein
MYQEIAVVVPKPKSYAYLKWVNTPFTFDTPDCPENMAEAGQLPLVMSPTISNVNMYHVLIDGKVVLPLDY